MVTRKEIYMRPRKDKKAFAKTAYHYVILFAVLGIVTYVGYQLLSKDKSGIYDRFFYVYSVVMFMILNFIFLFSITKRGVSKTLGLVSISALAFIIFNLASPFVAKFIFSNLEPDIISFFLNNNIDIINKLSIKDTMFFNYIPVFLSLAMWALLTLIMHPFSKVNSSKRDRKANLEIQREL